MIKTRPADENRQQLSHHPGRNVMNAMRMFIALVWLSGLLPGMAQASDADRFCCRQPQPAGAAAEQWAAAPQAARLPLLQALQRKISIWIVKNMLCSNAWHGGAG
jgi:hypothetical protein